MKNGIVFACVMSEFSLLKVDCMFACFCKSFCFDLLCIFIESELVCINV